MPMVAYPEMILLNLLTLIERLDLDFGYDLFSLRVRIIWFFDVPFHFDYTLSFYHVYLSLLCPFGITGLKFL